jgi:hypothetical protein
MDEAHDHLAQTATNAHHRGDLVRLDEVSATIGVIAGYLYSGHLVFTVFPKISEAKWWLWFLGFFGMLFGLVLLFVMGFALVYRSPLAGLASAAMSVCWTAGGNLIFRLISIRWKARRAFRQSSDV